MSVPRPITERQTAILHAIVDGRAETATAIAHKIGIDHGPRRNRGPWAGRQSAAQYVIGSLTGLRSRGFVAFGHRRDGLSGTAYVITQAGCDAICSEPNVDDLDCPAAWDRGI